MSEASSDVTNPCIFLQGNSPLFNYRFNINDFTLPQLLRIRSSCVHWDGNWYLKNNLKDLINAQSKERGRFIRNVILERRRDYDQVLKRKLVHALHLPDRWGHSRKKKLEKLHYVVWQPPENIEDVCARTYLPHEAYAGLPPGSSSLTGWQRLKWSFFPNRFMPKFCPAEPSHRFNLECFLNTILIGSMAVGVTMAVAHGLKFVSDFDRTNLSNIYASRYDAHRKRHDAFFRGFVRFTYRWGWRVGFLIGGMTLISQSLCIYRLKDTMANYMVAAFFPFSLYKWTRGVKGMAITGTIGAIFFGVPLGFLCGSCGLNPRLYKFDTKIHPFIASPQHWYNWPEEKMELSERKMNLLLEELNRNLDEKEASEIEIYRNFLMQPTLNKIASF
ncbi:complex I assembly factor TIMMDC1, mitochondrial-like [Clavelina lepadiformis]|uniref:complex I assembly factor TIMMDC1, mitochondrial-like n=1 Tax=Clavelina lepadiformis TaxID=159417 RepID=UPI0040411522